MQVEISQVSVEISQVSVQTITVTFAPCTVEHNDKSNDTCCDILNEQSCHTDVIKELYKSNKNQAEKSKDGSGTIFNHLDSPELALFSFKDALNEAVCHSDVKKELYKSNKIIAEKPNEDGSDSICSYVDRGKLAQVAYKDILNEQSCHTDVIKELCKSNKNKEEKSKDGSGTIFNHLDSPELALFPFKDALNEAVCHTDVKKELYKSNKIIAEKPNEDGSDSKCSYVDRGKLAQLPYKESLSALQNADFSNCSIKHPIEKKSESMEIRKRSKCEKMERGNDIAHKQNNDTNKAMDKIDRKDEKYIKRQEKKNRRELLRSHILHEANFDTKDKIDQKDKKSFRRQNKRNGRERVTPVVDLQPEDKNKDNQNLDKSQVEDVIHLGETPKSTKESLLRIYSRKKCSSVSNFSNGKWFKFACLFTVMFSARVFCINENADMDIQFPANPILFGTDVVLSCYMPFSENMENVSYFAWRNQLTAEYLASGNRSMNVSKYEPVVIHTESGINYTFRINSFDHDDFNMLYECNIGFLKGHVNLSACNTTFIYLPKNEDITSHNVRKGGQETMVIEMKRVHPNPVCKLFIKNKMISDRLYNATVGTVLIYYSLRFEFPRDNLVQYCYRVLEITCSVSGEQIHHNQTINFSSCRENAKKSDNHDAAAVIVTVIISILLLLAAFCIVLVYLKRKRLGNLLKNSNGSGGKRAEESATSTLESLIINEDDNG